MSQRGIDSAKIEFLKEAQESHDSLKDKKDKSEE
jgi:hypothetical protein